ncbi:MAG: c-type cytochrome [Verrucomicrobiota bacterium]
MFKISHLVFSLAFFSIAVQAQVPEWIWHPNNGAKPGDNEVRFFRKTFTLETMPKKAVLMAAGDDEMEIWINDEKVFSVKGWNEAKYSDVTKKLMAGENMIAIRGRSESGDAAILARIEMDYPRNKRLMVSTDASWQATDREQKDWEKRDFKVGGEWTSAKSRGKLGVAPWGDVIKPLAATPVDTLTVLSGFNVELLHSAQPGEGTWICMTADNKGRLIVSPQQDDLPLFRITLKRSGKIEKIEPIPAPMHQAMGLLYAHDSLYVNAHGPNGTGLYRLVDKNKNDQFDTDEFQLLKNFKGEGEHGYHAVVQGSDKMIYVMNGNHTKLPEGVSSNSPHQNFQEDFLLPRQWDAGGHAVGILAPGGHVLRTDAEGKNWELMLGGFRNAYDFDFNAEGEMFAFDSDMEWEWGMPWYKPTRILHSVSGAEFGWRSGSAKWPAYYADGLPPVVNIGLGSPTGVKFGTKSKFPEKYKRALFAMDWSYGRIVAVHLQPDGASYTGTFENFVKGKPLNVTDLDFGKDGAMYFITGGRGTQSGLYRVTPVGGNKSGPKKTPQLLQAEKNSKQARQTRRMLEAFHGKKNPAAMDAAWPFLSSEDRFLRFAARLAIEAQDVALWKTRALEETKPQALLTALLALARVGGKETQRDLLMALRKIPVSSLSDAQQLEKLRIIELSFIRQGKPTPEVAQMAGEKLSQYYPATSQAMNRELCQLLVFLEAPGVVEKTFTLLDKADTLEDQIHYIFCLRNLQSGWTIDQRKKYFAWFDEKHDSKHPGELVQWFADVGREYADGASFSKHLVNIKKDAIGNLTESEKVALADIVSEKSQSAEVKKPVKERKFVKEWTVAELDAALEGASKGRNFESGKTAYADTQCITCHRLGNEGGSFGPELTAAASKYSRHDILSSILEPSKVVSDQFQNFTVIKKDGTDLTGRIVDEKADKIVMQLNPFTADRTDVMKSDIVERKAAKLSPMPEALLNNLSKDEILDLIAYIEAVGKSGASNFKK